VVLPVGKDVRDLWMRPFRLKSVRSGNFKDYTTMPTSSATISLVPG